MNRKKPKWLLSDRQKAIVYDCQDRFKKLHAAMSDGVEETGSAAEDGPEKSSLSSREEILEEAAAQLMEAKMVVEGETVRGCLATPSEGRDKVNPYTLHPGPDHERLPG